VQKVNVSSKKRRHGYFSGVLFLHQISLNQFWCKERFWCKKKKKIYGVKKKFFDVKKKKNFSVKNWSKKTKHFGVQKLV